MVSSNCFTLVNACRAAACNARRGGNLQAFARSKAPGNSPLPTSRDSEACPPSFAGASADRPRIGMRRGVLDDRSPAWPHRSHNATGSFGRFEEENALNVWPDSRHKSSVRYIILVSAISAMGCAQPFTGPSAFYTNADNLQYVLRLDGNGKFLCSMRLMAQSKTAPDCFARGSYEKAPTGLTLHITDEAEIWRTRPGSSKITSESRDAILPIKNGAIYIDRALSINPPPKGSAYPIKLMPSKRVSLPSWDEIAAKVSARRQ